MENQLDKIISFAKEKQQTDVNSHRGAYQTIIDYCQALRIHDVVGQSEQLFCDVCGSNDVIEAPHMGKNCNRCHPL